MLKLQVDLHDLMDFVKQVPGYPITAEQLVRLAKDKGYDASVIEFYDAFPALEEFVNKEDLAVRTEQVEMLNQEPQPIEMWTSSEED